MAELESDLFSFHLGETFNNFTELQRKLEAVSKHSFVHFWRRDSRTVYGAHMKTARPINKNLKYYSVRYACIYGGQKFLSRGVGRRQSQSIRTDCPAHVMLRASKDGNKLEVTSLNNDHNHERSENVFKNLPQERKLSGEIKEEVQDLMTLHIDRKRLKEYVRLRTNKILHSKDFFNLAAANKRKRKISPNRAYQLFKKIHDIEHLHENESSKNSCGSEEEVSQNMKRAKMVHDERIFVPELEQDEENEAEDSCEEMLGNEELSNDVDAEKDQSLLSSAERGMTPSEGHIISEMVGEVENGEPSVIVESIVNPDGSVFVEERPFNVYCSQDSPSRERSFSPTGVDKMQFVSSPEMVRDPCTTFQSSLSPTQEHQNPEQMIVFEESSGSQIWLKTTAENSKLEDDADGRENMGNEANTSKVVISDEASSLLLQEQLALLKEEKVKLQVETEMMKLKKEKLKMQIDCQGSVMQKLQMEKDNLKMQIDCQTSVMQKLEMEKEKLRLEIKILKTKVADDDVSHYIFVP